MILISCSSAVIGVNAPLVIPAKVCKLALSRRGMTIAPELSLSNWPLVSLIGAPSGVPTDNIDTRCGILCSKEVNPGI